MASSCAASGIDVDETYRNTRSRAMIIARTKSMRREVGRASPHTQSGHRQVGDVGALATAQDRPRKRDVAIIAFRRQMLEAAKIMQAGGRPSPPEIAPPHAA